MSPLKTQETNASVADFINTVTDQQKRDDSYLLLNLLTELSGKPAKMWGNSLIGFDKYVYKNTGKGGEWPIVGFSPRKTALTLYIMTGFSDFPPLMEKLGKYKTGKSCLYIKRLSDIDLVILKQLISASIKTMKQRYSTSN